MMISKLVQTGVVRHGALLALLGVACSAGPTDDAPGNPRPANVPQSTTGGPSTTVTSSSSTLDLANRLAEPDAELHRFMSSAVGHAFRPERDSFESPSWNETGVDRFRNVGVRLPARSVDTFRVGLGRIGRFGL